MMTIDSRDAGTESKRSKHNELLLAAVVLGEKGTVRRLLESRLADINAKNEAGLNCLQLAIIHRHPDLAAFLIESGIDVRSADSKGWTALHDAALCDSPNIVRALLLSGCSPEWTTLRGERAIDVAGSVEMEEFLRAQMSSKQDYLNAERKRVCFVAPRVPYTQRSYPLISDGSGTLHVPVNPSGSCDPCYDVMEGVYKISAFPKPGRRLSLFASPYSPKLCRKLKEVNCANSSCLLSTDKEWAPRKAPREFETRALDAPGRGGMGHPSVGRIEETADNEKESPHDLYSFDRRDNQSARGEEEDMDAVETLDLAVPVALLRTKPRKSSIATRGGNRRVSDSLRRSVTFQPEVLLQDLVADGDAQALSEALKSGLISSTNINKQSPSGLTALHQTALDGNLECLRALVRSGAYVNCVDCENCTPLHAAVMQRHGDVVRYLLDNGADPTLKNSEGETPYDLAKSGTIRKMLLLAMNRNENDVDLEISEDDYTSSEETEYSHDESDSSEEGPCYFTSPNTSPQSSLEERLGLIIGGSTASLLSSTQEQQHVPKTPDSVFALHTDEGLKFDFSNIPAGVRFNSGSSSSCSSLVESEASKTCPLLHTNEHKSCSIGDSDLEKISEDQGISTMDGSSDGLQCKGHFSDEDLQTNDTLDSDLVPGTPDYLFQQACLASDVESVLRLEKLRNEIDVDRVNKLSGITALHHCVLEENFALVQFLVKRFGVNVNVQDRDRWTPLHAASAVGNIHIAQFLLDNGAKASILDNNCEFPVDVAEAENEAMVRLLERAMLGPATSKHHSCSELSISA